MSQISNEELNKKIESLEGFYYFENNSLGYSFNKQFHYDKKRSDLFNKQYHYDKKRSDLFKNYSKQFSQIYLKSDFLNRDRYPGLILGRLDMKSKKHWNSATIILEDFLVGEDIINSETRIGDINQFNKERSIHQAMQILLDNTDKYGKKNYLPIIYKFDKKPYIINFQFLLKQENNKNSNLSKFKKITEENINRNIIDHPAFENFRSEIRNNTIRENLRASLDQWIPELKIK